MSVVHVKSSFYVFNTIQLYMDFDLQQYQDQDLVYLKKK